MEKYGFVYIWYDRKHKRYYIGSHWGTENDGYVCSSSWMNNAYKRRPEDFKRRMISRIYTNKKDLLEEEYKFLSKIKNEELGKKYYNLKNYHFGHWTSTNKSTNIKEKISASKKGCPSWNKGIPCREETKEKLSKLNKGIIKGPLSKETKEKISAANKGKTREYKSNPNMARHGEDNPFHGKKHSEETRNRISEQQKGMIWITNDEINTRINSEDVIPNGFRKGRFLREEQKRKSKKIK